MQILYSVKKTKQQRETKNNGKNTYIWNDLFFLLLQAHVPLIHFFDLICEL